MAAALALRASLLEAPALVLLLSPALRQSSELYRKVKDLYLALGRPVAAKAETALTLELVNGSRIVALPGGEGTIRGYSGVSLLIVDEAARVDDSLYFAVRPMLAVSNGQAVGTQYAGRQSRGWFHAAWQSSEVWERVRITAEQCPRITPAFLAEEREAFGERWFKQEYCCSFEDVIGAVFSHDAIMALLDGNTRPLFG